MSTARTPGVYIEEISKIPPSISQVPTAIPAFIGYTEKATTGDEDLLLKPYKISSSADYEKNFGFAQPEQSIQVTINSNSPSGFTIDTKVNNPSPYLMYYALQLYFKNGGGPCYIVSVGNYAQNNIVNEADLKTGLGEIEKIDEITLIIFPDAIHLPTAEQYYNLHKNAMIQCNTLRNRFTLMDVWKSADHGADNIATLRNFDFGGREILMYGAAYYPQLVTKLSYYYHDEAVAVNVVHDASLTGTLAELFLKNTLYYNNAKEAIAAVPVILPPSAAVAGVYRKVDETRGVWKAPANVNLNSVVGPDLAITDSEQDKLNIDPVSGKSINAIRIFKGRGNAIIWGARTLAGNDNEWKYIPVRRLFIMVEESCKKATQWVIFEPNDANTWVKLRAMIENFLTNLWKQGALQGTKTNEAFYVHTGIGTTMSTQDILDGRLIIEIGMAVVRPAEFIILRFMYNMQAT